MNIDLNVVYAAVLGAGAVIGTIAAAEKYISSKFKGAVLGILRDLEYDRELRHLKRNLGELNQAIARLQDSELEAGISLRERIDRVDAKTTQCFTRMNEMRLRHEKLETAARVLGATMEGNASITAILADRTEA